MATATKFFSHHLGFPWKSRNQCAANICPSSQLRLQTFSSLSFSSSLSKVCLSMTCPERTTCQSGVCMARRYSSNSWKRQVKSRRRGGDPAKKRKRKRKGSSRKETFKIVKLVSNAGTGYVYTKRKGRGTKEKLQIQKYDPKEKRHVLFTESK